MIKWLNSTWKLHVLDVTGYTKEEYETTLICGITWFMMTTDICYGNVLIILFVGLKQKAFEHRIYHKNGSIRWIKK